MTKLPQSLEKESKLKAKEYLGNYDDNTDVGWTKMNDFSEGFESGALAVLEKAENGPIETLKSLRSQMDWYLNVFKGPEHEFAHWWMVEMPSEIETALAEWEEWKK